MRRIALAALVALLAACSSASSTSAPKIGAPAQVAGVTTVLQCVPMTDTFFAGNDYEMFPGCANVWDLDSDFTISDGGNDQWDGALELAVGSLGTTPPTWDSIQTDGGAAAWFTSVDGVDLQWRTPVLGADALDPAVVVSDGATTAAPAITGHSAYLSPGTGTALRQALDLTAAQGAVTLSVNDLVQTGSDNFGVTAALYRIAVLDGSGAELAELDARGWADAPASYTYDLSAHAGQRVTLSFEFVSPAEDWTTVAAIVDDVSVKDASDREFVRNGGFESGLTGWTALRADQPYGVASSPQTLRGLSVTRSFYTRPGSPWARFVDEFRNDTDAPISTAAIYWSNLGSDDSGIIYRTPGTQGALTSWDGMDPAGGTDRDVAIVFGDDVPLFQSATWMEYACPDGAPSCGADGSDTIWLAHPITVPAAGTVTLVHFLVQGGGNTAFTATAPTARATAVDKVAASLANGFETTAAYRDYMTQEQLDSVTNL